MGWSIGYDENWKRDIGYGVMAYCDHPDCREEINRGLAYVCADEQPYGGMGCGLYFCATHKAHSKDAPMPAADEEDEEEDPLLYSCCERCRDGEPAFAAKPDHPLWTKWKLADASWRQWREQNGHPEPTAAMLEEIRELENRS